MIYFVLSRYMLDIIMHRERERRITTIYLDVMMFRYVIVINAVITSVKETERTIITQNRIKKINKINFKKGKSRFYIKEKTKGKKIFQTVRYMRMWFRLQQEMMGALSLLNSDYTN